MARFLLGLVLGVFLGALAVSYNPNLGDEARAAFANLTALAATGAQKAAQSVDSGAAKLEEQAQQGRREPEPPPANTVPR